MAVIFFTYGTYFHLFCLFFYSWGCNLQNIVLNGIAWKQGKIPKAKDGLCTVLVAKNGTEYIDQYILYWNKTFYLYKSR